MAQSLARNLIHLIFSTKNRASLLPATIRPELNDYTAMNGLSGAEVVWPFQGEGLLGDRVNPGRCPGLSCLALSGRGLAWDWSTQGVALG